MNRIVLPVLLLFACSAAADTLLAVNKRGATLAFVDPVTMTVKGKVATGEEPHEVAVSQDGKIAVVGNYGGSNPGTGSQESPNAVSPRISRSSTRRPTASLVPFRRR
jgi:DNA-binding beta-propeller fold protein YncE